MWIGCSVFDNTKAHKYEIAQSEVRIKMMPTKEYSPEYKALFDYFVVFLMAHASAKLFDWEFFTIFPCIVAREKCGERERESDWS